MPEKTKLVRIKPYNKALGHVRRRLTTAGYIFKADAGWYEIKAATADMLAKMPQDDANPRGQMVFDVVSSRADAKALEKELEVESRETELGTSDEPIRKHARPGRKKKEST